jgi:Predicted ATPase (AAA+ superfamily)
MIRTKNAAFINRSKELQYLYEWVSEDPDRILFVYGPKSSGKTTLMNIMCNPDNRFGFSRLDINFQKSN